MIFAERLKELRTAAGLSQEKLAERLGVSRQVITKWETDRGTPDMENLMSLAHTFGISLDELVSGAGSKKPDADHLYDSVTEYDIGDNKRFDIKLGRARSIEVTGYDGEKIRIRLASDTIETLQSDFKIKVDDIRGRLDVELNRKRGVAEATARDGLDVTVELPQKYVYHVELKASAGELTVRDLECEDLEFGGKVESVLIDGFSGAMDLNCNLDMKIDCRSLKGSLDINQLSAISRVTVPGDMPVSARSRGIGNSVYFQRSGAAVEDFSQPEAEAVIELNGLKSELFICAED